MMENVKHIQKQKEYYDEFWVHYIAIHMLFVCRYVYEQSVRFSYQCHACFRKKQLFSKLRAIYLLNFCSLKICQDPPIKPLKHTVLGGLLFFDNLFQNIAPYRCSFYCLESILIHFSRKFPSHCGFKSTPITDIVVSQS